MRQDQCAQYSLSSKSLDRFKDSNLNRGRAMSIRRMTPLDLDHLNLCNLDYLTENYDLNFYLTYLMQWPSMFLAMEVNDQIVGYSNVPSLCPLPLI